MTTPKKYQYLDLTLTFTKTGSNWFNYFKDGVGITQIDLTGAYKGPDPNPPTAWDEHDVRLKIANAIAKSWGLSYYGNGSSWGLYCANNGSVVNPWTESTSMTTGIITVPPQYTATTFVVRVVQSFNNGADINETLWNRLLNPESTDAWIPINPTTEYITDINYQNAWSGVLGTAPNTSASFSNATAIHCFIYGTIFRTLKDNTEVPIEVQNLKVGDVVKTEVYVNQKECQFSLDAWQKIKHIIHRPLTADEYANKTRILPKDAFGPGKPDKDLHVTWGHGLLLKEMKEEWKNDEYNGDHITYSKEHALVKGDFIKLLAGHCALCRKPNDEENKKADEEREKRAYYHLELEGKDEASQHALVTHGVASESLVLHPKSN